MEFSKTDILRLIERASAIPELLSRREEIETLVARFKEVEAYLERFQSLEELITHLSGWKTSCTCVRHICPRMTHQSTSP